MSTTAISHGSTNRPAVDVFVERMARGLLRWTEQRSRVAEDRALRLDEGHGIRDPRDCAAHICAARDEHMMRMWSSTTIGR